MKLLSYIGICGAILVFAACKKSVSNNIVVHVSSTVPAQIAIKEYGSDASQLSVDTTTADLTDFIYSFKGISGQTLTLNVIGTGASTLSITTTDNGSALKPFSAYEANDGSSASIVYGIP